MQEKKHPLLAFLMPPAAAGWAAAGTDFCHAARGGGLRLPPAAAGWVAAGTGFCHATRGGEFSPAGEKRRDVTFLLVQESNQRSTPKGATLTRRSPLWNPLLAARAVRNSTAALAALYNSCGFA